MRYDEEMSWKGIKWQSIWRTLFKMFVCTILIKLSLRMYKLVTVSDNTIWEKFLQASVLHYVALISILFALSSNTAGKLSGWVPHTPELQCAFEVGYHNWIVQWQYCFQRPIVTRHGIMLIFLLVNVHRFENFASLVMRILELFSFTTCSGSTRTLY